MVAIVDFWFHILSFTLFSKITLLSWGKNILLVFINTWMFFKFQDKDLSILPSEERISVEVCWFVYTLCLSGVNVPFNKFSIKTGFLSPRPIS